MKLAIIYSQKGFSIVEILISFGLMMIVGTAMTMMNINTQKTNKALQQKLTAMEYEQSIN